MTTHIFSPPEPPRPKPRIQPAFIPFQGCPTRCVFCAQTLQTGETARAGNSVRTDLETALAEALHDGQSPREIAFYGGTFTALPEAEQAAFLALAVRYRAHGLVTKIRASTRPDTVTPARLAALRDTGLDMLELGVQSFADAPLAASRRGYTGKQAEEACRMVAASGLELGIQLMPGMPGMAEDDFGRDLELATALAPAAARLYPCLVLTGTELAARHGRGEFIPWSLERTVPLLANAQLAFWRAGIPVIRIGLAPQDELDNGGILAGPAHPALGSMVRGLALYHYIREELEKLAVPAKALAGISLPRQYQGEFWGHKGELKRAYTALGVTPENLSWSNEDHCTVWQQ